MGHSRFCSWMGADNTKIPRVKSYLKIWNFWGIFLKMKKKHGISEAFSCKQEKMVEFPIPFQNIQFISEHILNFKWNFRSFIFYKKWCHPQGDSGMAQYVRDGFGGDSYFWSHNHSNSMLLCHFLFLLPGLALDSWGKFLLIFFSQKW